MIQIRPVSDLRNKYSEVEKQVIENGDAVILTKNGYGSTVLLSLQQFNHLTGGLERELDLADRAAASTSVRYTLEETENRINERIKGYARIERQDPATV